MTTRRKFLQQSSLLTAGLFINKEEWFKKNSPIGVQLYTLRNEMSKDPKGSLEKIAKLGYNNVETYGYKEGKWFGMNPAEFTEVLKANRLISTSGHTFPGGYFIKDGWEDGWKQAVTDAKAIGQEWIVVPYLEDKHRSIDSYKVIADGLNKAGEIAKAGGVQLAYHNHDFEFNVTEGQNGFDILAQNTDPKLVHFELDLYWAAKAGRDPLAIFAQYPGRISMWHVKDMDKTEKKSFTEVGNGVIDFKAIFKKRKESGLKYFFVEQDICPGSPFDSIEKSINYLKQQKLA